MSCTQFHCIKMFILRHAWLNLWDKHMTTGRINQVTTFHSHKSATHDSHSCEAVFSWGSSSNGQRFKCNLDYGSLMVLRSLKHTFNTPCSPISQISDVLLQVMIKRRGSESSKRTTIHRLCCRNTCSVEADSQVVGCNRFSYQQSIHSLRHCKLPLGSLTWLEQRDRSLNRAQLCQSQASVSW